MDIARREIAPLVAEAWKLVDAEATRVLRLHLAGRKVVDFRGPHGWPFGAVATGEVDPLATPDHELTLGLRRVQPLLEVRVPIRLDLGELESVARGRSNPDLSPVRRAAERIALVEDRAIFQGLDAARITGMLRVSPHRALELPDDLRLLPRAILEAKEALRKAGVDGPYALLLGAPLHDRVMAATEEGHSLAKRIEQLLVDRPLVRAEALTGAVVVSARGGDYELIVGQDLSIGYASHTTSEVELYITESFTFRVLEPGAAVAIGRQMSK